MPAAVNHTDMKMEISWASLRVKKFDILQNKEMTVHLIEYNNLKKYIASNVQLEVPKKK